MHLGRTQLRDEALDFLDHIPGAHHQAPTQLVQLGVQLRQRIGEKRRPVGRHRPAAQDARVEHEQRHHLRGGVASSVQHGIVVHPQIAGEQGDRHAHATGLLVLERSAAPAILRTMPPKTMP
jgi:hypothetical protein